MIAYLVTNIINLNIQILAKRLDTFARNEAVFTHNLLRFEGSRPAYGTRSECLAVLVADMMSDQEEEVDETNLVSRFRCVPTYRSMTVSYHGRVFEKKLTNTYNSAMPSLMT